MVRESIERVSTSWTIATLLLLVVAAAMMSLSFEAAGRQGLTADEPLYFRYGVRAVTTGDVSRVARSGVAPLPMLLTHGLAVLAHDPGLSDRHDAACGIGRDVVRRARTLNAAWFGVPLLIAIFYVIGRRHGPWAGLSATALLALSPSILAHLSIAATDAGITTLVFLSVTAMAWHTRSGSWGSLGCLALVLGLALATKYSAIFLVPIAAGVVATSGVLSGGRRMALRISVLVVSAFAVAWGTSGFQLAMPAETWVGTPDLLKGVKLPAPVVGFLRQLDHGNTGHSAFFMGALRRQGGGATSQSSTSSRAHPRRCCC